MEHSISSKHALRRTSMTLLIVATTFLGVAFSVVPANAQPASSTLSARTIEQIAALQQMKRSLNKPETKMDSRLVVEYRRHSGMSTAGVSAGTGVEVTSRGTVLLDLRARDAQQAAKQVRNLGATVTQTWPAFGTVRADVPIGKVEQLAALPQVDRVDLASDSTTGDLTGPVTPLPGTASKADQPGARPAATAPAATTVVSEGVQSHGVDTATARTGVTGAGVKLCALSDGVDGLTQAQQAGELPAVDVLPYQQGWGSEGTAMLEILHDVAPGAQLGFATAVLSDASFAENIKALRSTAHCDIIVDDVLYYNESPFQDGIIAQAVNDVTADGALFFSSAGNQGNVAEGTAAHWEGNFVAGGHIAGIDGTVHSFDPGPGVQLADPLYEYSNWGAPATLFWSDPLGRSANDYDLYLIDQQGNVVGFSQNPQTGTQDPYERLSLQSGAGYRLVVIKVSGADRYLSVEAFRSRFSPSSDGLRAFATPGELRGHAAAENAIAVAAAPAAAAFDQVLPGDPPNPTGPYPGAFTSQTQVERFTSDGPRRVFYRPDGSPITPGNVSATGGTVRQTPTITAADGVSTSTPGFSPFFGTSAAAPHAAAIAGLIKSGRPTLPAAEIRREISASALDILTPGWDNVSGSGVMMADTLLARTGAQAQAIAEPQQPQVTSADGTPYLKPGMRATIRIPVYNRGDGAANNLQVSAASTSQGVTITPASRSLGTLPAGGSTTASFTLTMPAAWPEPGLPVQLQTWVSFQGYWSPRTATFALPEGQPATTLTTFSYTGPPVQIPDADSAGVSVRIPVTGIGWPSRITFSIDGAQCTTDPAATTVGINHSWVSDLVGTLTAPNGQHARVFANNGGNGHNLCQVVFDDSASTPFSSVTADNAPFAGTWRPIDPLARLLSGRADGDWVFTVADMYNADTGAIQAVSLHLAGFTR